ncbi:MULTISPECIES: DNA translocase FtsK [Paraclostridium]|uniref:DNA translocase FtsK n=1 Tax=Paraclostridium TaxID=1849822 RepID=UPI00038CD19F|nr:MULTISPECIES: DNA translocase FtsK [Paraclostridium]EQK47350.1 ftsK/SpoIIIE family protein [[Clostridium] bifermentans ATCC 19299] [Paraclostridium bifermentans ATCC 19299]MBZ6004937.1 DNA translocase FtsK [Paraclostridium bifermentans]MCR1875056.1 DNA translocase FtsK [Paraclostridium bifermentans]MDU0295770.1 DNA translocase FtsK [Paraclostridium sp. MRS3W1]TQO58047.1 DNA translocase FtsK [Paraclostridium bifermentans]
MAKKKSKKKKKIESSFSAEYNNLITIFIGIFLLYSLNSSSMGLLGTVIQNIFKGLFGGLAVAIPFIIIISGILGFFEKNEYIYRIKNAKIYYLGVFFIFIFYGLLNAKNLPIDSPTNSYVIKEVSKAAVQGEGCGLIATFITYYVTKILGVTGAWLISIFALLITGLFTFNISLKDLIYTIKAKAKNSKDSNLTFKEKAKGLKNAMVNMVTEEVDENTMVTKNDLKNKSNKSKDKEKSIEEYDNDKTIKIVGFNKAEDDYLEILEGTQSMPELEVLKELQKAKPTQKTEVTSVKESNIESTQPIGIQTNSKYENYTKPSIELLNKIDSKTDDKSKKKVLKNASLLEKTLSDFGVEAKVNQVTVGPTITRYEIQPSPGVKVSKIVNLTDDIALSLAAKSIRIEAPIPGKSAIGIEVPNEEAQMVTLREVIESEEFNNFKSPLAMGLGKDIAGKPIIADIGKMPHLLIAGSTGSGKSVCVNTLINSILYKANPDEVKFLLIDPKVVELANYNGIPHLLIPVVTDPKKAANALNWAVTEMNRRYKLFAESSVKDITSYNEKSEEKLPKIVIIIDELADLMMVSASDVEDYICRLAQMARAAGMHLIVATQRPSVDVITGVIKANIPSRIAFAVSSQTDSRTILDMGGAEKLLGKGDMLFYPLGAAKPVRLQGAFISESESERVVDYVKSQVNEEVKYEECIVDSIAKISKEQDNDADELLGDAIEFVVESGQASASMLQRKFKIGFNRAARLIDSMEERSIVGQSEGSKPRKVLVSKQDLENLEGE